MLRVSVGDISTLQAAVQRFGPPEATTLVTSAGSPNDSLWSEFAERGWMSRNAAPRPPGIPDSIEFRGFEITAAGREPLRQLLSAYTREHGRRGTALSAIYNTVCVDLTDQLVDRVGKATGELSDLIALLAMSIARVVVAVRKSEQRDEMLSDIMEVAKREVAKKSKVP